MLDKPADFAFDSTPIQAHDYGIFHNDGALVFKLCHAGHRVAIFNKYYGTVTWSDSHPELTPASQ